MKARKRVHAIAAAVLAVCSLLGGVHAASLPPKCSEPGPNVDLERAIRMVKPSLLYRLRSPYRRLYVEVDAVQGCEPDEAVLAGLRDFLARFCDKPDGIEIVRGAVIPRKYEPGLTAEQLACRVMKGPPTNSASGPPAFMEILFYDSDLFEEPPVIRMGAGHSGASIKRQSPVRKPQTDLLPYPVIVMNTRYFIKKTQDQLLLHEAGHMLGLVTRTNFAANGHCLDPTCLMYPNLQAVYHIRKFLLGDGAYSVARKHLCQRCLDELAADAELPPVTNLHFAGPVLVRSEQGYSVLSLPNYVEVMVGGLTDEDCRKFAVAASTDLSPPIRYTVTVKEEMTPEKLKEIAHRSGSDPNEIVRQGMAVFCEKVGLFTNAADIYAQSIQWDPQDDFSYNNLAWMRATSSDPKFRDGREAARDATKACELTEWKNPDWIDTLAAAHAECGDFKLAIGFEKQALHLRPLPDRVRKEMQDRLALYEKSQPYRGH